MPADQLHITLIQPDIIWEDKESNKKQYETYIAGIEGRRMVVVLPEMCTTGFSMNPEQLAETMDGPSVQWMKAMASKYRCILTGSLIIEDNGNYYNRLVWMQPDGNCGTYDKRHLFAYAGEDAHYASGSRKLVVSVNGWRICPLICYDLRFPVWSRNILPPSPSGGEEAVAESDGGRMREAYDVLLYVANWPERRSLAWKTLLQARAIENQSYVVGVNRVGIDGAGINYSGDSSVFSPLGEIIWQNTGDPCVQTLTLEKQSLCQVRQELPFLRDADSFILL